MLKIGGIPTPMKNVKVRLDHPNYRGTKKMFQTSLVSISASSKPNKFLVIYPIIHPMHETWCSLHPLISALEMPTPTRWCPRAIAKLVHITPITMVFVGDLSKVFMGFIKQFITFGGTTLHGTLVNPWRFTKSIQAIQAINWLMVSRWNHPKMNRSKKAANSTTKVLKKNDP